VARLIVNPHVLRCLLRPSLTEAPSLHRRYPASSVLRTSPPPHTARSLASCQLILIRITAGASRVASGLLCVHAIAITPAGPMKLVRSSLFIDCGLPCVTVRSAPAIVFSGPAQRSLKLWPARSRSRHATLSIESSDSFVASAAASITTGWSEPVPGREFHPLKSSAFHGALLRQLAQLADETKRKLLEHPARESVFLIKRTQLVALYALFI
jgi:hypothetical protein